MEKKIDRTRKGRRESRFFGFVENRALCLLSPLIMNEEDDNGDKSRGDEETGNDDTEMEEEAVGRRARDLAGDERDRER